MKIKRFFAPDIRQAIRMVREEQGPDAVILSNRTLDDGVEIVSAVDYDENVVRQAAERSEVPSSARPTVTKASVARLQPASARWATSRPATPPFPDAVESSRSRQGEARGRAPQHSAQSQRAATAQRREPSTVTSSQDPILVGMRQELQSLRHMMVNQFSELAWDRMNRQQPERVERLRKLMNLGLAAPLCREIADEVEHEPDPERAWQMSLKSLARRIPVADEGILHQGGVVALVGPTGVGKTTTIAKLAARFCLRYGHRHVALVTTDSYRIGAHEQLHNYGRILDVPARVAANAEELHGILNGFSDKRLVLIDTAGMGQRDLRLAEQIRILTDGHNPVHPCLVVSATTQRSGLEEVISAYRDLSLEGCILTKVDEAGNLGEALSAIIRSQLSIAFFGDGQRVPEDLHQARAHTLVERALALLQQNGGDIEEESMAIAFGGTAINAQVSVTP